MYNCSCEIFADYRLISINFFYRLFFVKIVHCLSDFNILIININGQLTTFSIGTPNREAATGSANICISECCASELNVKVKKNHNTNNIQQQCIGIWLAGNESW